MMQLLIIGQSFKLAGWLRYMSHLAPCCPDRTLKEAETGGEEGFLTQPAHLTIEYCLTQDLALFEKSVCAHQGSPNSYFPGCYLYFTSLAIQYLVIHILLLTSISTIT
jgi:hypothetical protein